MVIDLYADVLFCINFGMDALSFLLAAFITHRPVKRWRLLAASALGALYATAVVFFPGNVFLSAFLSLASLLLICAVFLGREPVREHLRFSLVYLLVSCLLGGVATAITGVIPVSPRFPDSSRALLLTLIASSLLTVGLCRVLRRARTKETGKIRVTHRGATVELSALCDSGNLLFDPFDRKSVIVVRFCTLAPLLPPDVRALVRRGEWTDTNGLSPDSLRRVRVIPCESVGGRRLLIGFRPDAIDVLLTVRGKTVCRPIDAILAFSPEDAHDFAGCDALIPASLVA